MRNRKRNQRSLNSLPVGLDATYDRMLQNVKPNRKNQVISLLTWLCFSARPLTTDELAEIFILDIDDSDVPFDHQKRLLDVDIIFQYLPSIVVTTPQFDGLGNLREGSEVRLGHFSITVRGNIL